MLVFVFYIMAGFTRSKSKKRLYEGNIGDSVETTNNTIFNFLPVVQVNAAKRIKINTEKSELLEDIKNAILPLKNEEKYCPEVYKFKTGKKDSNEYQIAIVFPECKKGGKKTFYSRKGRRNKRSRKTRKRK